MKFEEALKAMRGGKMVKISMGTWRYKLDGNNFQSSLLSEDYWVMLHNIPCFLILTDDWEVVDD